MQLYLFDLSYYNTVHVHYTHVYYMYMYMYVRCLVIQGGQRYLHTTQGVHLLSTYMYM